MHELSLCRAIAGIASRHAGGRPVRTIGLRVGHLRQVVPDTLAYCWPLVCEGTPLAGSRLEIESVPARIACRGCRHEEQLATAVLRCTACGGDQVTIVAGEEFLLTTLDLAEV
jgi:hydrogenase nickel incorporation protein HypA/HybF